MAGALARGWGIPSWPPTTARGRAQRLVDELGGEVVSNAECAKRADVLILAHKPYQLDEVASGDRAARHRRLDPRQHAAGRPRGRLSGRGGLPRAAEPARAVRRGVIVFADEAGAVKALFERVGTVVEVPERLLGAVNAVTGVGPAYWALFAEAWTDAAIRHGIPAAQAATLVTETMAGTAALLTQTDTLALRRSVASPGGSTARGLNALEQDGVRAALANAMDAVVGG